ncbi:MAG: hypothetical protein M1297_00635 [Nitrospirae bacterium]|jgi:hypothetical protein|nr:hypothetical protein [Nitrospirota bacterium]
MTKGKPMKKIILECDLCDRGVEAETGGEPGFYICPECWEDLRKNLQLPFESGESRSGF